MWLWPRPRWEGRRASAPNPPIFLSNGSNVSAERCLPPCPTANHSARSILLASRGPIAARLSMWEGKSRSSRSQWSQSAVSCVSGRSHGDFRRPDVILTRRNRRAPPRGAAPVGTAPFPPSSALIGRVKSRGRGLDEKGVARARALRLSLGGPGFVLFSARRGESGGGEVSGNGTEPGRGPRLRNRPGERSQERGAGSGERCGPRPVDGPRNGARGPEPGRGAARPGAGSCDRIEARRRALRSEFGRGCRPGIQA